MRHIPAPERGEPATLDSGGRRSAISGRRRPHSYLSPPLLAAMDSSGSSPRVTRAARVYGRRRQPEVSDTVTSADSPVAAASPALSTNSSPAFSTSQYDPPPSSSELGVGDTSYMDDDDESHGSVAGSGPDDDMGDSVAPLAYDRRSIKDLLASIDQQFDEEDMDVVPQAKDGNSDKADGGPLSKGDASHSSEDLFGGTLPQLSSSSQPAADNGLSSSPAPRRVLKRRVRTHDSDSDSPAKRASHTSPQTSPGALHPINTPHSHSSHTPPTSQDMTSVRHQRKGKERSQSVDEDDSDAQPDSTERRRRKSTSTRRTRDKRLKVSLSLPHSLQF